MDKVPPVLRYLSLALCYSDTSQFNLGSEGKLQEPPLGKDADDMARSLPPESADQICEILALAGIHLPALGQDARKDFKVSKPAFIVSAMRVTCYLNLHFYMPLFTQTGLPTCMQLIIMWFFISVRLQMLQRWLHARPYLPQAWLLTSLMAQHFSQADGSQSGLESASRLMELATSVCRKNGLHAEQQLLCFAMSECFLQLALMVCFARGNV